MREYTVERARYLAEIERLHERRGESNLPVRQEATQLLLGSSGPMRRLFLVGTKRSQLPVRAQDLLHHGSTKATDQLVFQIPVAHVEPESFHLRAAEIGTKAGALKRTPELALLSRVAETGQLDVGATRTVEVQEPADRVCPPDRQNGNAFGRQIPATSPRERLQRDLVTDTLNQHDCSRLLDPGQSDNSNRRRPRPSDSSSERDSQHQLAIAMRELRHSSA
jgi:hypothetical protein